MRQERGISPVLKPIGHNNSSPVPGALSPLHSSNPVLGALNNSLLAGVLSPLHHNNQVYGAPSPLRNSSLPLTPGALSPLHHSNPEHSQGPWAPAAAAQPAAWAQQPFQQPPSSPPPPAAGNAGIPSWQQGPAQGQGFGAPGIQPDAAPMFGANDNDKTMLRPSGPQGALGTVRVEEGKEPGRVYEVRKDELSIGRSRESDIFLEDLAVSRLHAKIVNLGNGNYALKDEGSANGTKVNGQLVNKYQTYPLQEGDKIQLGQTVLVFASRKHLQ